MEQNNRSTKLKNYAMASFFIILTILAVVCFLKIFVLWSSGVTPVNIQSECRNNSAYVFIGANEDLKDVKCVALDIEYVVNPEIAIGDLSKNDEDVCRFKLSRNTTEPLRFEVWYNGEVKREVCKWQHYPRYVD
ncbi:MAG: hypothetical protein C5S38_08700 [Candidatus Methanophagaceae archaeon]|nr:MAG: hypothetical protein C5S38_08700 [Methanophagales archaeon]KAF5436425.1 hypothetical protein C5S36_00240 [Methanophagales archaeon]